MKPRRHIAGFMASLATCGLLALVVTGSAWAHSGEYARFNNCPSTTEGVYKCIYSVTESGTVVLGKKTVPIVNPVTLQGGVSKADRTTKFSQFYAATNGVTLSKTPQPVPGGLTGLVNCKEISLSWLRTSCEWVFENGLTGVNATLELARPASEIQLSEAHLVSESGVALKLPVRMHLENPLLGSECFIGSSGSPIMWNLTTGETSPPAPNAPIHGSGGTPVSIEEGLILELKDGSLVDNAWSAPGASGCGGWPAEYILDPIIEASVGVPSAAGHNTAILNTTSYLALASTVNEH